MACAPPRTIQVVITPTPDPDAATTTPLPTNTPEPTLEPTFTEAAEEPTLTETATDIPQPVEPSPTFLGPIIRPDYILPTLPPQPTATPFDIPTVTGTPLPPTPRITGTPTVSPTPLPQLDATQMGLQLDSNYDFDSWMQVIGLAEATGVGWVKIQVNWAFLQPDRANDFNHQMQLFERQVEAAARPEGIRVLLSVAKAPGWARSNFQESGPPDNPQALADFITFMLRDTKIGQSVDAIEIWNEPNLAREWRGTLPFSGAGYMQLFRPSYDAIRAYSSTMTIITAGLAPTSTMTDTIDDRVFLQQMYDAGLGSYRDVAIGAHPYGWGNAPDERCCGAVAGRGWNDNPHFYFIENIEATYNIMTRNGHADQRIWITEFGWASWENIPGEPPEEWMRYNTAADQANYTIRAFEIGQSLPHVGPMILWNLNFANTTTVEQGEEIAGYSIINPVIFPRERPLYWMLGEATRDD